MKTVLEFAILCNNRWRLTIDLTARQDSVFRGVAESACKGNMLYYVQQMIEKYVQNSHGATHNQYGMKVLSVFAVKRDGQNFKDVGNR